ncbi:ABC transporter ATP-binding protein [Varunaivibrio sulfuroxidans]|uniref:Spermidine/putrescine import ATP-binding protein PotA n=1 Tax=Varunaivibrio sulfuroxidans TaxID=1773489 RepID=A0A4R3JDY6_9PROT|nr:ABC transporter ATP-binding protein [Varunaivibrio sulfuroxidans]TCS63413.1 putrescine transport system ATP-binding protein [Varunaivibrio sulfuroxidans]WES30441.1 ABC transporter ATP-binding protein [Varunaivibrio sulfuroxidans]
MVETTGPARKVWAPWDDADNKPFVRIEGVTKKFGDFVAVDNITLDIFEREFFSLLGPSGCGKTTLLRMLAGFETPSDGRILLDGEDMSRVPPHKRPVNMMFQSYALFPHMTVEKNIAFGLKQDGISRDEIGERVGRILALVQLGKFAARKPDQLSGGQRQRVALARALVKNPKILLLDEPLGALDKKLREETQFELMNIQEKLGITFIIVTHDQEEAMTVSSRIALMDQGRVVQVATPSEIYEAPNSRKVAEFIGEVNIFECRVDSVEKDCAHLESAQMPCRVRTARSLDARPGDTVWSAIRPEKMVVSLTPPGDLSVNCIAGEVWDIAYLGKLSVFHVKTDSGLMVTVTQTNRLRETERTITWEDRVYITWSANAAVVLRD